MSTQTLTRFYCSFCDIVANCFKGFIEESRFDPNWDSQAFKQLSDLSDRELRDIGICRSDIKNIAKGGKMYRGGDL